MNVTPDLPSQPVPPDRLDLDVQARPLGHLPLITALVDHLGVGDALDELLPIDPRSNVSDADCVTTMILNILSGRVALYRMELWTQKLPVDLLIGPHCTSEDFTDARLARALDHLFEVGTDKVLGRIVQTYLQRPDRPHRYSIHQDGTSVSVYGAYEGEPPAWAPRPVFGFSKDHRPDLKQLVFGLSLHGATGLPLVATMLDGNTSDSYLNAFHIESLAGLLPDEDDVTLVADSKLVDTCTLGTLLEQGMHFVSLVPRTFNVRDEALERLGTDRESLSELGRTPARKRSDPDTVYRGRSFELPFRIRRPGAGEDETVPLRLLAVHSDSLATKFEAGLPHKLEKDRAAIDKAVRAANRKPFSCEQDAQATAQRIAASAHLHRCQLDIVAHEVQGKRPRGRPRNDSPPPPTQTVYQLVLTSCDSDPEAVEALRRSLTHFVLITDHLDATAHSDADILAEYRHQHIVEGHCGFRWLKGPGQVAPVFLERPERIAALGLVLVLALMVRNYLQFTLRAELAIRDETVPYYDRKRVTATPTAEVIWELFSDVVLLVFTLPEGTAHRRLQGMDDDKRRVLDMLGLDESALLGRRRKPPAGRRPNVGM